MENKKNDRWYILGCLAALLILVIIDQWSKELAVHGLKDRDTIVLIPGVFELFYLENRGAAFGIFENMRWMFLSGTGLILVLAVFLFRRFPKKRKYLPFLYFAYHDRCRGQLEISSTACVWAMSLTFSIFH